MYSRSYNTSNNVPPNYNGTSINPKADDSESTVNKDSEKPYARVPLMDMPVYSSYSSKKVSAEDTPLKIDLPDEEITQSVSKKIAADDILLIGLLIILLGGENKNIDIKLVIAIGALLFAGL